MSDQQNRDAAVVELKKTDGPFSHYGIYWQNARADLDKLSPANKAIADAAWTNHFAKTTKSYKWYLDRDLTPGPTTQWGMGLAQLATITDPIVPPDTSLSVTSSITVGQTIAGKLPWTATVSGGAALQVTDVVFLIDGTAVWTEHFAPYVFNGDGGLLDTATLTDGAHVLAVRATTAAGVVAKTQVTVTVKNAVTPPPPPAGGLVDGVGVCAYRKEDLPLIAALGIRHARMDNPPASLIEYARTLGIEILPIVGYNPWSDLRPPGAGDHYPPTSDAQIATWAKRMVDQWRPMPVFPKAFEPWNEPWNFWDPPKNPAWYLKLVQAFAHEAWAVPGWENVTILVSADPNDISLNGVKVHWRDALLAADTGKFLADPRVQPTVHIYCGKSAPDYHTADPTNACQWDFDRYKCVGRAWTAHGNPATKVFPTELGWETDTPGGRPERADLVTEQEQADFTVAGFLKLLADGCPIGYSFAFKTDELDDYNWLDPTNRQKRVCAAVKAMLAA